MKSDQDFSRYSVTQKIHLIHRQIQHLAETAPNRSSDVQQLKEILTLEHSRLAAIQSQRGSNFPQSHQLYLLWLKFLITGSNLEIHIRFVRRLIVNLKADRKFQSKSLEISVYPSRSIFTFSNDRKTTSLKMHEALISMSDSAIRDFISLLSASQKQVVSKEIRHQFVSGDAQEIKQYFERNHHPRTAINSPKGKYFNLDEIFNQVNQEYFAGKIGKPALHWSARPNKFRMGSYNFQTDAIMINSALDRDRTPAEVIRYLMYHEMLHKTLGIQIKNGRNHAHTAKFRKLERQFKEFEAAETYLNQLRISR